MLELIRAQETELPLALKWQIARADEEYDFAMVEARRITVEAARVASESFPFAVPPEEAERRCRRALAETWAGRETAALRLPPSRLALDAGDVVRLDHDGRLVPMRLLSTADGEHRGLEAMLEDRGAYDPAPGAPRPARVRRATALAPPTAVFLDLPQLTEAHAAHQPLLAASASPWPGAVAVWRSPTLDNFELVTTLGRRARLGALAFDFFAGPVHRWDHGNELWLDLTFGSLASVTDAALFAGANALAVEAAPGVWEIVHAANVVLVAPGRYRLTRLLRGQRGTEWAMGNPAPAGARVVVLDEALAPLPIAVGELGIPWNWRIGPAQRPPADETYVGLAFAPEGVGLKPFAPVHLRGRRRADGGVDLSWVRRTRALEGDSWNLVEVPLTEHAEAYDLEILAGASVVRTVAALSEPTYTYSEAAQVADFGAPVSTIGFRVFQRGALGRGTPAERTIFL